jgi:hypothetical protein
MHLNTLSFSFILLVIGLSIARAEPRDSALEDVLKQQLDTREEAQIQQSIPVELDARKPGLEQAVLWTIIR